MIITVLLLFSSIIMAILRELCFKIGANKAQGEKIRYFLNIFGSGFIWLGFLFWISEVIVWVMVLGRVALNVAFPILSLSYCGALVVGKVFLKEQISTKKWLGVFLITLGVSIIGIFEIN